MDGRKKKFIKELITKPRLRRESGLFVVDGPKMCSEIPPELCEEIFISEDFLSSEQTEEIRHLLDNIGYELVKESEMKQLSDTVTPQGILALVKQRRPKGLSELIDKAGEKGLFIVLESVQDPGNVGTILRASEAAGCSAMICDRGCADIYSPKVVRSTMGALFRVPVLYVEDLKPAVKRLKDEEDYEILAAHLAGSIDYDLADMKKSTAVLIGNESRGLSDELSELSSLRIKIPMCGNTESLNAAMAASVILFEAARQRRRA